MPDLRSNWLPFYRPYSFASQPFDCFAENIQFRRSCIAVQPPFVRLPDCFFILSCSSSFVKILRPGFSVFADLFPASRLLLFCSGPFSAASPSLPKKHPARRCLREASRKEEISGNFPCFTQKTPPLTQKALKFYPPPCYIELSKRPLFSGSLSHVVVRLGRDGGALPCPVPIYYRIYVVGGIFNGLLSQTRHARPGACSGAFPQEKGISPSPRCRTTDRSPRSRLCHDDRHDLSCFCRYV